MTDISELIERRDFARRKVRAALRRGDLRRPSKCEECGAPDTPMKDGRSSIQGHHYAGYDKVLEVQWLCVSCHRKETPAPYGNRSSKSKLDWPMVDYIRSRYAADGKYYDLAREIGVDPKTVFNIVTNRSWPEHARPILSLQSEADK